MSNNIFIRPGNDGIVDIPGLNCSSVLYVKGKKFEDYIKELVAGDQFEQSEIDEIRQIIQYLNTSGLTTEWVVGNNNINATLKTAIDALTAKLTYLDTTSLSASWVVNNDNHNATLKTAIDALNTKTNLLDTTALTQSWAITDANKNATLKTRIDNNDTSLGLLDTKTQYVTSATGNNASNPKVKSTFLVSVQDRHENRIVLDTGGLNFLAINSFQDATQNTSILSNVAGKVELTGQNIKLTPYQSSHNIDIGLFGISNTGQVNIGGSLAKINIGSLENPIVGTSVGDLGFNDNTIITIGKRTNLKNTTTNLQGNFYTPDARWESLTKSSALTWTQLISLISTSGLPLWVASFALSSSIPNFSYSDLWSMKAVEEAGGLIKNGEVETTKGAKLKSLTVFDSEVGVDIVPKEGTFFAKGHISKTTLLGDIKLQTFNGEVLIRANNISPSNINWALTEAMDSVNALKISNNDVELIAGAGANGSELRISNTTSGPIKLRVGTGKLQANAHDALNVLNSQATSQVQIGNASTTANRYDTTSKVIIDHTQLADGLKVCKASGSTTRVNHDSVNTGGIILQDSYAGSTTKALYTIENGAKLMYYGDQVYPPVTQLQAGTAGITYLIDNPTNLTNSATIPSITMSGTYTPATGTTITRSGYTVGLSYQLATIKSDYIPSGNNPILDGLYEANLWANYQGNSPARLYSKLFLTCETTSFGATSLITKAYSGSGSGAVQAIKTLQLPVAQVLTGLIIQTLGYVKLDVGIIVFPGIQVVSSGSVTLTCTLIDNNGIVLYTFPTISATAGVADRTFSAMNGANPTPIEASDLQFFQFQVAITTGTGTISQASARGVSDANYQITLKVKMMLYDGVSNQTSLNYNTTELYALTLPLKSVDITQYTIFSKIEYEPYFIQVSGSANNHSITLLFRDGNLSHIHSTINPVSSAVSTPNLTAVLNVGSSAGFNNISDVSTLTATTINTTTINPTNITNWNVKNIVAGSNVTVSNNAGEFTINSTASVVSPQVYAGTPTSISSIGGYSNNQYLFGNSTYDFDNYNYDIEFVINQGSGNGYLLHFCWDNNVDFTYYQVMYNDWDATGNYIGSNPTAAFMYTQNINNFQASYKGTLRAIPAVSASNYNRLMLEGTMSMNSQSSGSRAFSAPARSSRTIISYAGASQNSIAQFNGSHSFSMWATVSNYASNNPCNMRITRVMKNLPGS